VARGAFSGRRGAADVVAHQHPDADVRIAPARTGAVAAAPVGDTRPLPAGDVDDPAPEPGLDLTPVHS
jgi:hypothetical protein